MTFLPTNPKKGDRVKHGLWIWERTGYCWTNIEESKQLKKLKKKKELEK